MNQNKSCRTHSSLQVGGITPLTTIDYPDELAAVIFCQGCPWRCRYCHNSELVKRKFNTEYQWSEILQQLEQRIGLLDAVVFSGGEPTLQSGLENAISDVREMGFKIGLHTAGCYPEKLENILPAIDWVGIDIKALAEDYEELTGVPGSGEKAWQSLELLAKSHVDFEVRITVHHQLLPEQKLLTLVERLSAMSVQKLSLQRCRTDNILDKELGVNSIDLGHSPGTDYAKRHFEKMILRLH